MSDILILIELFSAGLCEKHGQMCQDKLCDIQYAESIRCIYRNKGETMEFHIGS